MITETKLVGTCIVVFIVAFFATRHYLRVYLSKKIGQPARLRELSRASDGHLILFRFLYQRFIAKYGHTPSREPHPSRFSVDIYESGSWEERTNHVEWLMHFVAQCGLRIYAVKDDSLLDSPHVLEDDARRRCLDHKYEDGIPYPDDWYCIPKPSVRSYRHA